MPNPLTNRFSGVDIIDKKLLHNGDVVIVMKVILYRDADELPSAKRVWIKKAALAEVNLPLFLAERRPRFSDASTEPVIQDVEVLDKRGDRFPMTDMKVEVAILDIEPEAFTRTVQLPGR